MLFKLSNLNSNLAQTLGYLNPALNNSALIPPLLFNSFLYHSNQLVNKKTWARLNKTILR